MGRYQTVAAQKMPKRQLNPSRKSLVYQRFLSISSYHICRDLPVSITIALRFVSRNTNIFLIDSFSPVLCDFLKFNHFGAMASRQTRRTPHNVYTQKRADREFQDFVQHSKSKNLPIPSGLASSSKRSQAVDDNHPNVPKRQKLAPRQVQFNFLLVFWSSLMLFVSSLS